MDTVAKHEAKLDAIVKGYAEQHPGVSEPEIHARLASTSQEYKAAYREAQFAKDVATAEQSTLLFGADRIAKVERVKFGS